MSYLKAFFNLIENLICLISSAVSCLLATVAYLIQLLACKLGDISPARDLGLKLTLVIPEPTEEVVYAINRGLIERHILRGDTRMLLIHYLDEADSIRMMEAAVKRDSADQTSDSSDSDVPE